MTWTQTGIVIRQCRASAGGLSLDVFCEHPDKLLQCYVSGVLLQRQFTPSASWQVELPRIRDVDTLLLLAVDPSDGDINYWSKARPAAAANRLSLKMPAVMTGRLPDDRWLIFRSQRGSAATDIEEYSAEIHPDGYGCGGFGSGLGGAFGLDGLDAPGWGESYGFGEFGFDCRVLQWQSQPLAPGEYALELLIANAADDRSVVFSAVTTLASYPAAASDLSLASYDELSDTLTLGFTPSPDIAI